MPTPRCDIAKPSFAERLEAIGTTLRRLILAGFSARAQAIIPAHAPRNPRCR